MKDISRNHVEVTESIINILRRATRIVDCIINLMTFCHLSMKIPVIAISSRTKLLNNFSFLLELCSISINSYADNTLICLSLQRLRH